MPLILSSRRCIIGVNSKRQITHKLRTLEDETVDLGTFSWDVPLSTLDIPIKHISAII